MLRPNQIVLIGNFALPFVENITIKTTRNDFTDTAEITIPNRIPARGKKISDSILKGSRVEIQIGYYPNMYTEFTGYVSQLIPGKTLVIKCENEAYVYKRQSIGVDLVLKNTNLKSLIAKIFPGTAIVGDANIGDWKISKTSTIIDVLSELQNKFKIYSYFRDKTLIVGADADPRDKIYINAHFQKNVPTGESSFNFKDANADRIVVKATSISRAGEINEIYAYYAAGTGSDVLYSKVAPTSGAINEFNIGGQTDFTTSDLKVLAKRRLEALSFTGVDGSITIYGHIAKPLATHGDICTVTDLEIPEKNGNYAIVEVVKRFGVGVGIRQDLGLGITI